MEMPPTAIWKVLPFATVTGAPLKSPNQDRAAAESVRSKDWIDQEPPHLH
jgi:hypothetical protein